MTILLEGRVKYKKGNKWNDRFCKLLMSDESSSIMDLYILEDPADFNYITSSTPLVNKKSPSPSHSLHDVNIKSSKYSSIISTSTTTTSINSNNTINNGNCISNNNNNNNTTSSSTTTNTSHNNANNTKEINQSNTIKHLDPVDYINGFESGRHVDKKQFVLVLIGQNTAHCMAMESLDEMFRWADVLERVLQEYKFHVTWNRCGIGSRRNKHPGMLHIQRERLCLIAEPSEGNKFLCAWPYSDIDSDGIDSYQAKKSYVLHVSKMTGKARGKHIFFVEDKTIEEFKNCLNEMKSLGSYAKTGYHGNVYSSSCLDVSDKPQNNTSSSSFSGPISAPDNSTTTTAPTTRSSPFSSLASLQRKIGSSLRICQSDVFKSGHKTTSTTSIVPQINSRTTTTIDSTNQSKLILNNKLSTNYCRECDRRSSDIVIPPNSSSSSINQVQLRKNKLVDKATAAVLRSSLPAPDTIYYNINDPTTSLISTKSSTAATAGGGSGGAASSSTNANSAIGCGSHYSNISNNSITSAGSNGGSGGAGGLHLHSFHPHNNDLLFTPDEDIYDHPTVTKYSKKFGLDLFVASTHHHNRAGAMTHLLSSSAVSDETPASLLNYRQNSTDIYQHPRESSVVVMDPRIDWNDFMSRSQYGRLTGDFESISSITTAANNNYNYNNHYLSNLRLRRYSSFNWPQNSLVDNNNMDSLPPHPTHCRRSFSMSIQQRVDILQSLSNTKSKASSLLRSRSSNELYKLFTSLSTNEMNNTTTNLIQTDNSRPIVTSLATPCLTPIIETVAQVSDSSQSMKCNSSQVNSNTTAAAGGGGNSSLVNDSVCRRHFRHSYTSPSSVLSTSSTTSAGGGGNGSRVRAISQLHDQNEYSRQHNYCNILPNNNDQSINFYPKKPFSAPCDSGSATATVGGGGNNNYSLPVPSEMRYPTLNYCRYDKLNHNQNAIVMVDNNSHQNMRQNSRELNYAYICRSEETSTPPNNNNTSSSPSSASLPYYSSTSTSSSTQPQSLASLPPRIPASFSSSTTSTTSVPPSSHNNNINYSETFIPLRKSFNSPPSAAAGGGNYTNITSAGVAGSWAASSSFSPLSTITPTGTITNAINSSSSFSSSSSSQHRHHIYSHIDPIATQLVADMMSNGELLPLSNGNSPPTTTTATTTTSSSTIISSFLSSSSKIFNNNNNTSTTSTNTSNTITPPPPPHVYINNNNHHHHHTNSTPLTTSMMPNCMSLPPLPTYSSTSIESSSISSNSTTTTSVNKPSRIQKVRTIMSRK